MDCREGGGGCCLGLMVLLKKTSNNIFVHTFLDVLNLCDDDNTPVLHNQTLTGSCWPGQPG